MDTYNIQGKKKKILVIFTGPMELGGIERSLVGLLDAFDYELYDVDLFLYAHHGELFEFIDPHVHLLPEVRELAFLRDSFSQKLKHGCFYSAGIRVRDEFLSRLKIRQCENDQSWAQIMRKVVSKMEKKYDLALGFFLPFDLLLEKVDAEIKVGWVHTDYSAEQINPDTLRQKYAKLDYIICVSEHVRQEFCSVVPEYEDRTIVVRNCISPAEIYELAKQEVGLDEMPDDGSIKLLSVGRFCTAKNFDNIPEICKLIKDHGFNIKWYLIGYGQDENLIRTRIKEFGMGNEVVILGKKSNPYPYIQACDLYVQPSRYEGRCVSVTEAQILKKPVVITNYSTSASQLVDGYDGAVVPMDNVGCAAGIIQLLNDPSKMQWLSDNCGKRDYSNYSEVQTIYKLLGKS